MDLAVVPGKPGVWNQGEKPGLQQEDIVSIMSVTGALFTQAGAIVSDLSKRMKCRVVTDHDIIEQTILTQQINPSILYRVMNSKPIPFNDFTREKEATIAGLRKTIAKCCSEGKSIFHGYLGHLIPAGMSQVLKVLIIKGRQARIIEGAVALSISENDSERRIFEADSKAFTWTETLTSQKAWNKALYDLVVRVDRIPPARVLDLIDEHYRKTHQVSSVNFEKELADFVLAAEVELVLAGAGGGLSVSADSGSIIVTIDRKVMFLSRFRQKIINAARKVEGVTSVETRIGRNYYSTDPSYDLKIDSSNDGFPFEDVPFKRG